MKKTHSTQVKTQDNGMFSECNISSPYSLTVSDWRLTLRLAEQRVGP